MSLVIWLEQRLKIRGHCGLPGCVLDFFVTFSSGEFIIVGCS